LTNVIAIGVTPLTTASYTTFHSKESTNRSKTDVKTVLLIASSYFVEGKRALSLLTGKCQN